jgi:plastocyanin
MAHDSFSPASITIPVNTTVPRINEDLRGHTVTIDSGLLDSKKIRSEKTFSYKLTAAGTYKCYCKMRDRMKTTVNLQ